MDQLEKLGCGCYESCVPHCNRGHAA